MSRSFSAYDCSLVYFDKHHSEKGNISVVQNTKDIPFEVKRVYYLYDVPGGESRGGHAHYELKQLIVAASGSFDVVIDDGNIKRTFTLNRPYQGLLVVPGMWRELNNFSSGSVCLVLASREYDEADYIRCYDKFLEFKKMQRQFLSNFEMDRYGLHLRYIEESDADFILKLRTDPRLSRYLNKTKPDKEAQIAWTKEYKKREQAGLDYYFIFEKPIGTPLGMCRIYDIEDDQFTIGSWLFSPDAPVGSAILADIITREIAFDLMPNKNLRFDVRSGNINVLKYQCTYKPTVLKETLENVFFELSKDNFEKYKKLYLRMFVSKKIDYYDK